MTEELLQFIWQEKLYHPGILHTCDGSFVEVIHPGHFNPNSGPDFFNAKIKIGSTLWAGNVEIHLRSSDWHSHRHHLDPAYNNVILHVVKEFDGPVLNQLQQQIPVLSLPILDKMVESYQQLMSEQTILPCAGVIARMNPPDFQSWLSWLAIDRIEHRCNRIFEMLDLFGHDWDQVFFVVLARSFGFGLNADPFELLARQTPIRILLRHADNPFQVEALLMGQAGLIPYPTEDLYLTRLYREYQFLSAKYQLQAIDPSMWKFLRVRPGGFPTIRLSQLAALLCKSSGLFDHMIHASSVDDWENLLEVEASSYWDRHYLMDENSKKGLTKRLGIAAKRLIMVNTLVPFVFAYGMHSGKEELQNRAVGFLESLSAENNHLIKKWVTHTGIPVKHAFDSQAIVHLIKNYCDLKKCLKCRIGHQYLSCV